MIRLFISFPHFQAHVATRTADGRSHGEGTLKNMSLYTYFTHFEVNVATQSVD